MAVSGNAEVEWIYVECDEEAPAHGRGKTKGKYESDIKGIVSPAAMDNLRDKYEEMGMVYVESDTKYTLVTAQGNSAKPYTTAGDYRFYLCGLRGKLAYCDLIDFAVEFPGFCAVGMISVADKFDKEHVRKGVGGFEGQKSGVPNYRVTQSWAAAHFKSTFSRGKPFLRSDDGHSSTFLLIHVYAEIMTKWLSPSSSSSRSSPCDRWQESRFRLVPSWWLSGSWGM